MISLSSNPDLRRAAAQAIDAAEAQDASADEDEHPKLVESLKQGWLLSYQAIAVVAALFAGMEASLITLAKTPEPDDHGPLRFPQSAFQNAVLGLAYVALALN
ncbi:hypothetical protein FRC00_000084, partial [Tulasnella sp. 408]